MRIIEAKTPIIESPRLTLRPLHDSDAEAVFASANSWQSIRYTSSIPFPYAPSDAASYIQQTLKDAEDGDATLLCAVEQETGRYVGQVGLTYDLEGSEAELSYLLDPRFQGRGYATEAAHMLMDWGFQEQNLKTIVARVFIQNTASNKVMSRLGFQRIGVQDLYARARGRTVQVFRYKLEANEFEERVS